MKTPEEIAHQVWYLSHGKPSHVMEGVILSGIAAAIQADREERVHKMDWRLEEHARKMRLRAERELAARVMQNEVNRHAVVVRGRGRPRKDGGPRRQLQPWEKRRAQYLDEVGRTEP